MAFTRFGKWTMACCLAVVVAGLFPAAAQEQTFEGEHEQELRQEAFWSTHRDDSGKLRPDLWQQGIYDFLAAQRMSPATDNVWFQVGPQPLRIDKLQIYQGTGPDSGEVVDIAIDPTGSDDLTVYIATNDGGIWKTTDGGQRWTVKTDFGCFAPSSCPSLSMGAVALSPKNPSAVFAGTGNPFDGGGLFTKGVGVYRSLDGGDTWKILNPGGIFGDQHHLGVAMNRIAFVLQAGVASGEAMLVATNMGLFRSIDDGDHFGNNPPMFNNGLPVLAGYISDLKVDRPPATVVPQALATVYAAVSESGIFKSTDGGITFPTNLFTATNGAPVPGAYCFISFAQSTKPNNRRLYASVENKHVDDTCTGTPAGRHFLGLWRSDDAGSNWKYKGGADDAGNKGSDGNTPCQCGYDQTIGVDPQDQDRLYLGFQELWLSTDGGTTFGATPVTHNLVHWDHHALYFSPSNHWSSPPTRVWVGEDGGVASSKDGGTSWDNLNETIATNLFKHIDVGRNSPTNIGYTYGGTQDTGTIEHRPKFDKNDWHLALDGDGSGVAVDPAAADITYGLTNQYPEFTNDGGDNWSRLAQPSLPSAWRYAVDPNNSSNIFAIDSGDPKDSTPGPDLYRSKDKGATFAKVATFLSNVRSIANTPLNSKLIWLGLEDGSLQRCGDALNTPPGCVATAGSPSVARPVGGIFIILTDPMTPTKDRVVAVYEGFSEVVSPSKHVFYTKDSGANWKDISNTLPDLPTHSVYGSAAISNDAGVMFTNDLGNHWQVLGNDLPTVDSTQLAGGACPPVLRIGTYGRSVFEFLPLGETGMYDNGPVDGKTFAWPITGGAWVSDSFRATGASMQGVTFVVWVVKDDVPEFVGWVVTDQPDAGSLCAMGNAALTPTFLFTNPEGFDVYMVKFDTPGPVSLNVGATYFLTFHDLITKKAGPAFWDQNSGVMCPGSGVDLDGKGANCPAYGFSPGGSIPSETFKITTAP